MSLPKISNYGNYSSSNYGAHTLRVDMGGVTVWFSYSTPVAFRVNFGNTVVHENVWGRTTGKHLNFIDGGNKSARVPSEEFERRWEQEVEPLLNQVVNV